MSIAQESIMSIMIRMYFNETPLSTGTGFVVHSKSGPVLITNRHNVTGRNNETDELLSDTGAIPNRIEIYHNRINALGSYIIKSEDLYFDEDMTDPVWLEHPILGPVADFVAIKLTNLEDVELFAYSPGVGDVDIKTGVTDIISVIGFPFGLQVGNNVAIWATGFVASEPDVNYRNLPLFLIDCRSRQGQSGSAVIAYRPGGGVNLSNGSTVFYNGPVRKFLGIYSGRIRSESDLGLVWKASAIKELIDNI